MFRLLCIKRHGSLERSVLAERHDFFEVGSHFGHCYRPAVIEERKDAEKEEGGRKGEEGEERR